MLLQSILPSDLPEELIIQDVLDKAGLSDPESSGIPWNLKSVSRADHPKYRIPQAVKISNQILKQTFGDILRDHDLCLWKEWLQRSGIKETDRYRILYGTVFLPAMFNAGQLYHDQHLSEYAFHRWKHLQSPIPKILLRPFDHPEITSDYHHSKLGSIYQLRSYCEQSRCHDCLVLKKAI
ncbi:hypothetical protein AB2B38_013205 [Balneola sp. MJW-20]